MTATYDPQHGEYYPDPPYDRGLILSQGWEAFEDRVPKSACPYAFATIYWGDWCDGWDEAQKELAVGQ